MSPNFQPYSSTFPYISWMDSQFPIPTPKNEIGSSEDERLKNIDLFLYYCCYYIHSIGEDSNTISLSLSLSFLSLSFSLSLSLSFSLAPYRSLPISLLLSLFCLSFSVSLPFSAHIPFSLSSSSASLSPSRFVSPLPVTIYHFLSRCHSATAKLSALPMC